MLAPNPCSRRLGTTLALLIALTALPRCGAPANPGEFDRASLEEKEDLSESLANDLLALSVAVRDRNYDSVNQFVAGTIQATPIPEALPSAEPLVKWIHQRHWEVEAEATDQSREQFVGSLEAFLERFEEISDARFKVKSARFAEDGSSSGEAHLKFFIIGRERSGHREWIKGTAHVEIVRGDAESDRWRLERFLIESLQSKISDVDLFSEVAYPAGLAVRFPDFGVGKNDGFVAHGAATADIDGDGLLDLATSGVDQNYLYINQGDGTFRDVSEESLVKFTPIGSGALFLDFDNDGDPDLFFAAVGRQVLLENRSVPDGKLQFWDVSEKAGVDRDAVGFSAVASDINADGHTDIYVCSYNRYGTVMPNSWYRATNGTTNLLLVNRGDGTFSEAAEAWGVDDGRWTYAAGFVDIDADGDQDLYVANDFGENAFFRNDGDRFTDVAESMGLMDPGFGMGVSFGDYDLDGHLDLHVTNMSSTAGNRILKLLYPEGHEIRKTLSKQAAGNSLYRNLGDGTFREVTSEVGGLSGGWAFGGGFIDFDNDGREDLYTPNGFVSGKSMKDT
jgi:hypothetical protein